GRLNINSKPYVIMLCGVNGVGKTTVAAKLAYYLARQLDRKVMLAAADTFRAAAIEQLGEWCKRIGCDFYSKHHGADPGAVAYEAVKKAREEGQEIVIVDTGGRLHTREGLMNEIGKVQKVIGKALPEAPHQVFLVIDGTQGQNVHRQAEVFNKFLKLSGIILTKMDGTARGGVVFKVVQDLDLPVFFIGTGETLTDLIEFDPATFITQLW
ncbi:MAG: signal recognition particle-docking protein FtsY, partial [Oligoflexia bacterium]|nr:signal recognition particle-docking protein FtsY [Oligoflexia bacterium]